MQVFCVCAFVYEAIAFAFASATVHDDHGFLDAAELFEELAQRVVVGMIWQTANEQLLERRVVATSQLVHHALMMLLLLLLVLLLLLMLMLPLLLLLLLLMVLLVHC